MNQQKHTFWTLNRHHAAGFTLVELIVVIAILAILAGVGIPAYSGYVTKTNMAADQTLVSEIKHAVTLALYEKYDYEFSDSIVVKLSIDAPAEVVSVSGTGSEADIALVEAALVASFGENWAEICHLKYDGWDVDNTNVANYKASSYYGNEKELLNTVSNLSGALAKFFASGRNIPSQIQEVLDQNGLTMDNSTAVANSTVLALAGNLTEAGGAVQDEVVAALTNVNSYIGPDANGDIIFDISKMSGNVSSAYSKYYGELQEDGTYTLDESAADMVRLASAATLYAYAEGFAQYTSQNGDTTAADILAGIKYTDDEGNALNSVQIALNIDEAFKEIAEYAAFDSNASAAAKNYFGGMHENDAKAFFSMMDAVDQSAGTLSSGLTSADCFGNAGSLIRGYISAGSILADGEAGVIINPNKDVVAYLGGIQG